jgi:4-hydroxythreonine-4-phosphate dehydrogenase
MPRIGITLGDPCGVGPEVIDKALAGPALPAGCTFEVLGNRSGFIPGQPSIRSAAAALAALEDAVVRLNAGALDAVVTGPVSKRHLHGAGFDFPGQTEFFAARSSTTDFAMCLTGGALTVALVTAHIPLKDVPASLSPDGIVRAGLHLVKFLQRIGHASPRVAVAGLNPHAGESGDLGVEEIEEIAPAVAEFQRRAPSAVIAGPLSPDTVFFRAVAGEFDGVLCMYHDQGLIPLKLHAFDSGVNVTLGLPFPRTSPDHGTAFDIAGKGIARPDSMAAAIRLAATLAAT